MKPYWVIRKIRTTLFFIVLMTLDKDLSGLIPVFIANFGLHYYQSASIIFVTPLWLLWPNLSWAVWRIGGRVPWFIPVGFSITLVSISASALATSYEMILALSLLAGVGAALFHPEAALLCKPLCNPMSEAA